jgi:pimeloyl-ACP methyl ester carboxylesterase
MESLYTSTSLFPHIHYRKAGSGYPLLLIHGCPENGDLWQEVIDALAEECTVLIPDTPGTGESKLVSEYVNIGELAESMRAILKQEGVEKAVVAGHSMGGYIALALAAQYPEMIAGLSLVHSTATADTEEKKEARRKSISLIRKGGKEAFVKGMIPNLFAGHFKKENPGIMERQVQRAMAMEDGTMIAFNQAMIDRPDRTEVLKTASFPVQFIVGKEDGVIPNDIIVKQKDLPRRSFVVAYEAVGHMSMIELPETLAADLKTFTAYCYNP